MLASVILLGVLAFATGEKDCFRGMDSPAKSSATKTPYSFLALEEASEVRVNSCEAVQFWLVARHGTRYPSRAGLRAIKHRLPEMLAELTETELCEDAMEALKKWNPPEVEEDDEKTLHAEGELEMLLLGERFQQRFPKLLSSDYHSELFSFRATDTQRAIQSQKFFATGLFGRKEAQGVDYQEVVKPHDPVIRAYKLCGKWQKEVKKNPESLREQKLFEQSVFFRDNIRMPLAKRLGYRGIMGQEDVEALYNGCVFGQAWKPQTTAAWCRVFSQRELDILEYREDLEYYWHDGFGYDVSREQLCVLMRDVMENFKNVTEKREDEENGVFYFSHSGTILKFLAFLGLFEDDEPLRHDNYEEMMSARRWRTSRFNSFGANVAFALQKCNNGESFKIGLFVNERLTAIPGCDGELWCDFSKFSAVFGDKVEKCNFDAICALEDKEEAARILDNVPDDRF